MHKYSGMKSYLRFWLVCLLCAVHLSLTAQVVYPTVSPSARYVTAAGDELEDASEPQSAPLTGYFTSNVADLGEYSVRYEWRIFREGEEDSPIIDRFDENIEYVFTESGTFCVQLYATFVNGADTIQYPAEGEAMPFTVSISESVLEMPNAFSPNGDGYNDIYKVKEGYQSIVSFKAVIFNRWGQKLYSWDTLDGGWDGKFHGKTVKDGVYFVVVNARGADGREYKIRRDVNVLTGYSGTGTGGDD